MKKSDLIKKIKAKLKESGELTTADVEACSSPIFKSFNKDAYASIERFGQHKVEAVFYVHETETNSEYVSYEDLSMDTLKEIWHLIKDHEVEMA
jgi:hypothetical protein